MAFPEIPNLVFSTLAPQPDSGGEGSRRVIAKSPDIPPEVEDFFENRADFTGSILRAELGERRIYTFSRIEQTDLWLFNRAVVLKKYRGGHNQFLIHGTVLRLEHLELLQGNPFLLDDARIQKDCGFRFLDDHPGTDNNLKPFILEPKIEGQAKELNRLRFIHYSKQHGGLDSRFSELFNLLLENDRLALALQKPDGQLLEWFLLHLHPHDRTALGFHTWYSHDRSIDGYRLILISPEDVRGIRQYFRDIEVWQESESRSYPDNGVGNLIHRLRERSPDLLLDAVLKYPIIFWGQTTDSSTISPEVASWCFHHALGDPLGREQYYVVQERLGNDKNFLEHFARYWSSNPENFMDLLKSHLSENLDERHLADAYRRLLGTKELTEYQWTLRWVFLAALHILQADKRSATADLCDSWSELVPRAQLRDFLESFDGAQAIAAEEVLHSYVLNAAAQEILDLEAPSSTTSRHFYWESFLEWLHTHRKLNPVKLVVAIEETADQKEVNSIRLLWYQRLRTVCEQNGALIPGMRLRLDKELPLLAEPERRHAAEEAMALLLEAGKAEMDRVAGSALRDGSRAEAILLGMAAWMRRQEGLTAWMRFKRFFANAGRVLGLQSSVACGIFLGNLGLSTYSSRLEKIFEVLFNSGAVQIDSDTFLKSLLSETIKIVRRAARNVARGKKALDAESRWILTTLTHLLRIHCRYHTPSHTIRYLLDLVFYGLIINQRLAEPEIAEDLLGACCQLLMLLAENNQVEAPFGQDDLWLDLLEDQLPNPDLFSTEARYDPQFEAFMRLAWFRWQQFHDSEEARRPLEIKIGMAAHAFCKDRFDWNRLRTLVRGLVPERLHVEALKITDQEFSE